MGNCMNIWRTAEQLPPMKDNSFDDFGELVHYEVSDPVLGYTADQEMVVVMATKSDGRTYWIDKDGATYNITHWQELPEGPEVK